MDKSWTELIYKVDIKKAKIAGEIVAHHSPTGIYIEDYSDMERMLPLIGRVDYIDEKLSVKDRSFAVIHAYIPSDESAEDAAERISERLRLSGVSFAYERASVGDEDWENDWKQFHKPWRVGKRLVISPSWEHLDPSSGDIVLTVDPGSAFGSGGDETTRVCLRLMEPHVRNGDRVLDMGCGSGALSIAALLLGAQSALGVDIDKNAVNTAAENAVLNGVGERFESRCGNVLTSGEFEAELGSGYDLICANIAADVHLSMRGIYRNKLRPGGKLILSGITKGREEDVYSAFVSRGFSFLGTEEENGWLAMGFNINFDV